MEEWSDPDSRWPFFSPTPRFPPPFRDVVAVQRILRMIYAHVVCTFSVFESNESLLGNYARDTKVPRSLKGYDFILTLLLILQNHMVLSSPREHVPF